MTLQEASATFFEPVGGVVVETTVELLEPEFDMAEPVLGGTVTVEFDNAGIFGDDRADIYDDVYPRYRALRDDWWRALAAAPDDAGPLMRPYLFPVPASGAPLGPALPTRSRPSGDVEVVPLDTVARSSYLDRMRREYGLEWGIRGSSGRLFDLAEGLLLATRCATDALVDVESFAEFGAGTGAVAGLVLRRAQPKRALVHDERPTVTRHLRECLGPLSIETGAALDVLDGDCRAVPLAGPVSLLVLGLPFAAQPSLLARNGDRIRTALGDDGLLVAASSAAGMRFYQSLVDGGDPRLAAWPWHVPGASLRDMFDSGATVRVRNLVISIASNSTSRVDATVAGMISRGAQVLP